MTRRERWGLFLLPVGLALFLCWPAWGQPYASVGEALVREYGCSTACVRPGFAGLTCGPFDYTKPVNLTTRAGWEARYGVPYGARGDHSAGWGVIRPFAERADNPLKLRQPYVWTTTDDADASLIGRGQQACYELVQARLGPACGTGWSCVPPPAEIGEGCRTGALRCAGAAYSLPLCWRRTETGRVYYSTARPECIPGSVVVEPPPPPPPPAPVCGDGRPDAGETCVTCPADVGPCEPPPPPATCEDVRVALAASQAEVERLRGIVTAVREAVEP